MTKAQRAAVALSTEVQWLPPLASRETQFRNKAKMVAGYSVDGGPLVLGILRADGSVQELVQCPLYQPEIHQAWPAIYAWLKQLQIAPYLLSTRRGELKYAVLFAADSQLMLRLVLRSKAEVDRIRKYASELYKLLPNLRVLSVNLQPEAKAILEGEQELVLSADSDLPIQLNGLTLYLRPQSFFQTNTDLASALYQQASEWLVQTSAQRVLDLFCGVGGFALHAAKVLPEAQVLGVELSAEAVRAATRSAEQAGFCNVRFLAGDALALARAQPAMDCWIVNPPRRGLGAALCAQIEAAAPRHLIYSSCNLDSLVRDLACLGSYQPLQARVLDLFAHTTHFEVIVRLEHRGGSR